MKGAETGAERGAERAPCLSADGVEDGAAAATGLSEEAIAGTDSDTVAQAEAAKGVPTAAPSLSELLGAVAGCVEAGRKPNKLKLGGSFFGSGLGPRAGDTPEEISATS
jgi:hypothetical protein